MNELIFISRNVIKVRTGKCYNKIALRGKTKETLMDFYEVVPGDDLHQKMRNFQIVGLLFGNFSLSYFMVLHLVL